MKTPAGDAISAVVAEDEPLLRAELCGTLKALWPELVICAQAADGLEALDAMERFQPQILFLDIQMPGRSGIEVAQRASGRAHVVFITAFDQYAVTAFEQGAVDYLLKPLARDRLQNTVARLKARLQRTPAPLDALLATLRSTLQREPQYLQWITVALGQELHLVTVGDICYFRSDEKYTAVVTANAEYLVSRPLVRLAEELDPKVFWRIHRSLIVNINAVRSVHRDFRGRLEIRLKHRPETLPVSAAHAGQFRQL